MNVKITLSVPVDEVESEVCNILVDAKRRIKDIEEQINDICLESANTIAQLAMIEKTRTKLNVVDLKLEDSYSILKGYAQYKMNAGSRENINDTDQEEQSNQDTTG